MLKLQHWGCRWSLPSMLLFRLTRGCHFLFLHLGINQNRVLEWKILVNKNAVWNICFPALLAKLSNKSSRTASLSSSTSTTRNEKSSTWNTSVVFEWRKHNMMKWLSMTENLGPGIASYQPQVSERRHGKYQSFRPEYLVLCLVVIILPDDSMATL